MLFCQFGLEIQDDTTNLFLNLGTFISHQITTFLNKDNILKFLKSFCSARNVQTKGNTLYSLVSSVRKRCWFSINNRKWSSSVFTILMPRRQLPSQIRVFALSILTWISPHFEFLHQFYIFNKDRSDRQILPSCMEMPSTKSFKDTIEQLELSTWNSRSCLRGRKDELRRRSGSHVRRTRHRGDNILDQMSKTIFRTKYRWQYSRPNINDKIQDQKPDATHQALAMSRQWRFV